MDWDDLRFVLEVRRTGSALGAAQVLGVNQSTVVRRIAHIEETLGQALFERKQSGYVPTPQGICVSETAERMEAEVRALESSLVAARRTLSGVVRLTTSETLANRLVAPWLLTFQKLHPGVRVELVADDRRLDVARGEADIALRAGSRPNGAGIVVRRFPDAAWSIYCSKTYASEHGLPKSREDLPGHSILGMEGQMARLPGPIWIAEAAPNAEIRFRSNSLTNLVSNLRAGLGVASLPCFVGDNEPDLVRCFAPPPELNSEMWLIVREDLKSTPHIRAFADLLADHLTSLRARLTGEA
ncbi:MAG: LysR family transcriptional regulator [Alphaproteobacteria bacterium]